MILVTVKNQIIVTGLQPSLVRSLVAKFSLPNAQNAIAIKRGLYTKNIPKFIPYVLEGKQGELILPLGMIDYLGKILQSENVSYSWVEETVSIASCFTGNITLRDYQIPIVDKVVDKLTSNGDGTHSGILEMGTGTGKTLVALEIARRLNVTTLVVVPNNVLYNQWREEIEKNLTSGDINIITWQSLASEKQKEINKILCDHTSLLIIDECNCVTSPVRKKTLKQFAPRYTIGLTATPDRTDGQGQGVRYLLGNTLARYSETELSPNVEVFRTDVKIPMSSDYHKIVDAMVENDSRNTLIRGLVVGELVTGRKVLVLTKRISHYKALQERLTTFKGLFYIESDDPARNDLLKGFKTGDIPYNAIFGTVSLLAVGTDIPSLDTIIIACDIKSSVLTTQLVGRILRTFKGKQSPKIIDLHDNLNPVFNSQFWSRWRLYKTKGWVK